MKWCSVHFCWQMILVFLAPPAHCGGGPDMRSVPADLKVPEVTTGEPAAGRRVKQLHPDYSNTDVYHVLYLPENWEKGRVYPVVVEYAGNGPYENQFGDMSSGLAEGSRLGYGVSAGKDVIWLCLPYLNHQANAPVRNWWGDKPGYDATPTVEYCKKVVPWVCGKYGGDPKRVMLAGFSRGAIACSYIGLYDDEIAKLWCGFIAYSHFDGVVETWPYPGADRSAAKVRLARLCDRPLFILHEDPGRNTSLSATRSCLESIDLNLSRIEFMQTGFRNHSDAWILRPSSARAALRDWFHSLLSKI